MFFYKRRAVTPINISMNNTFPHFNYLEFILGENLSWNAHVTMVTGKLSETNGILNRLKQKL